MQFKLIKSINPILKINNVNRYYLSTVKSAKKNEQIIIPKAIPRNATDILKALSSTVEKDYTGPHYKYLDDPYLTPLSQVDKRAFALSKESGRKAAKYFMDNYPELFYRDISEPKIEAFTYKEIYDESMEFNVNDLKKSIIRCDVSNAIICYQKLIKDNIEIDNEILHDLLDLVCFYNCENETDHYVEEDYFQSNFKSYEVNTWKDNGFAEKLFESIEPKNDRTYSSIIMGMAKYFQVERAFSMYEKAIDLNLKLNTETYNSLINISYNLNETNEQRWKTIIDLLQTMNRNKIPPNIGTLNSILKQLIKYKLWSDNHTMMKKVFNEFAFKYNIEPSLGTYSYILQNIYRSKYTKNPIIYDIINKISARTLQVQSPNDVYFFINAMDVAYNKNDLQLGYKINSLADQHPHLLGPSIIHNNFYNKFLNLCLTDSIENFMEIYNKYTPHIYTPNADLIQNILKNIKLYKAFNYLPKIYNDILLIGFIYRSEIINDLLETMNEITKDDPMLPEINLLVLDLFQKVNIKIKKMRELEKKPDIEWNYKLLSLCMSIHNKSDDMENAYQILERMNLLKDELFDDPDKNVLAEFCLTALTRKQFDHALYCLKFCKTMKPEVIDSIKNEFKNISIPNDLKTKFKAFFD